MGKYKIRREFFPFSYFAPRIRRARKSLLCLIEWSADMDRKTAGTVVSVKKQWWLKVNTKPVRMHALDGATFPHIIKVSYMVNGTEYFKRKWIRACDQPPAVGAEATVLYDENNPRKSKVLG